VAEYTRRERANQESKNAPDYMTGASNLGVVGRIQAASTLEFPTASSDPLFMQTAPIPMGPARWRPITQNPMLYAPGTVHASTADRLEQRIIEARRAATMLRPFGDRGLSLADQAERQAEFLQGLLDGTRSADGGYVPDQLSATEKAY